jgi:hypothetical protein
VANSQLAGIAAGDRGSFHILNTKDGEVGARVSSFFMRNGGFSPRQ